MIPLLLILIPLLSGLIAFFLKNGNNAKAWALISSIATLAVSLLGLTVLNSTADLQYKTDWMAGLGSTFSVKLDGMGHMLCLLTAISFPVIFVATWRSEYKKAHNFFALMLLSQAGLMGVFLAMDALLFYFFWELALIPVYFLCSQWGGEKRIAATFKFFIYTFTGSVLMLIAIIYIQANTADQSFDISSFYNAALSGKTQSWVFWLMFLAFAIKMPVFPFHTWQPDTYEQSPTAVTMVLSAVMVKMGIFAVIRWLLPVLPLASVNWAMLISVLCVIGIIYASLLALQQDDLKRLVAYSSIAHIGLMCLAIFTETTTGMQGVMMQMFNHGINIIGLWVIVELIERKFGTRKMSELGGLAQKAPSLAIFFVVIALANIALPLTNAFIGEFLMFNGVFSSHIFDGHYTLFGRWDIHANNMGIVFAALAGIGIILAAVYTLRMVQKVLYGNTSSLTAQATDIRFNEKLILGVLLMVILVMGIYPQPLLDLTQGVSDFILKKSDISHLFKK
ncbi:MAG: NADH-quinone oxidoreductase subunit M [Chitinophagaceae bacterium]|nr:MAG: NADH-quinone oxidoreductase subunit M [Chitinophagaceae bacterium]